MDREIQLLLLGPNLSSNHHPLSSSGSKVLWFVLSVEPESSRYSGD